MYQLQPVNTDRGEIYILTNKEGAVHLYSARYLKYLLNLQYSPFTLKNICISLKRFLNYLEEIGVDYKGIDKGEDIGIMTIFSDFIVYLQKPALFKLKLERKKAQECSVIDFNEYNRLSQEASSQPDAMSVKSIKAYINNVIGFYEYMSKEGIIGDLQLFKTMYSGRVFKEFLFEMNRNHTQKKSIFAIKINEKDKVKYVTEEQVYEVLEACRCTRDKLIVCCGFYMGMRIGEILNLRIDDLDLINGVLHIVSREGNMNQSRVKNASEGKMYILKPVIMMFVKYLNEIKEFENKDRYVFLTLRGPSKGTPMNYSNVQKIFITLSNKVGFEVTPHMLRHGYAVKKVQNGATLLEIQKDLRHKSVDSTLVYAEFMPDDRRKQAEDFFKSVDKSIFT